MPTPKMVSVSALRMMPCCANTSRISHPQVYLYPIVHTHPLPFGPWYLARVPMKERSAVDRPQEAQQVTAPQIRADGGDAPHCIAHAFLRVFHTLPVGGHPECQKGAEPGPWPPSHGHSLEKPYLPTSVTEAPKKRLTFSLTPTDPTRAYPNVTLRKVILLPFGPAPSSPPTHG